MEFPIPTAIVGPGKVAGYHAKAMRASPLARLVAVVGRNRDKTDEFARLFDADPYSDLRALIEEGRIKAATVCTPHPCHREAAVPLLEAGIHTLVEKPLASSTQDCDAMLEAAARGGAKLGAVSQRRLFRPCLRMKEAIAAGRIGRPILATASVYGWRDRSYYESDPWRGTWAGEGGGLLVNQAVHQIDLLLWLMGPTLEVLGFWDNFSHPYIEVEDTAVAVARFANGGLGALVASNSQNPPLFGNVRVHGSNGASVGAQTDSGQMFIAGVSEMAEPPFNDLWTIPSEAGKLSEWRQQDSQSFLSHPDPEYYHRLQIDEFLQCVAEGKEPSPNGEDGRRAVAFIESVYRSRR